MCTPLFIGEGGGVEPLTKFKKKGGGGGTCKDLKI